MNIRIIEITGEPILHGGQEKFLSNLIEKIDYSGIDIDVLTPYVCDNTFFRELVQSKGGKVFELNLKFNPGKSRRLLFKPILSFLKDNKYDVVHVHSGSISVLAYVALASKKAGVKKVVVHSHSTGVPSLKHSFIRFFFGFIIKNNATDFLACSKDAGIMKYPRGIVDNNLIVIKNGIDIGSYKYDPDKRESKRRELGIGEDVFVIGHVGRFSHEKNHEFLIKLFFEFHNNNPNSMLLLVGDGELINIIKENVRQLNLNKSVVFTGNVDNVQDYYQAMNIFLLPSLYEGLPYVTLEAQANGMPCVLSTGVPEDAVISDCVTRLSLDDIQLWYDTILKYDDNEPIDNTDKIKMAGYDIVSTAEQVKKIYLC